MNEKLNKMLHKGSSVFALAALIALQIPVLMPYQALFIALAGALGGGGLVQDAGNKVKAK